MDEKGEGGKKKKKKEKKRKGKEGLRYRRHVFLAIQI
jgi:hypothetical protein